MAEEITKQEEPTLLHRCMQSILGGFEPASLEDADDHITTAQFIQSINEHTGEYVTSKEMFDYLVEKGFTFARTGNSTDLKWLLKKKEYYI